MEEENKQQYQLEPDEYAQPTYSQPTQTQQDDKQVA